MSEARLIDVALVEDNPADARLLREYLREARFPIDRFRHFETLGAAIEELPEDPPDVVLLDLSLPDAHGLQTVERALASFPHAAIVVLTGLNDEELAGAAVQTGAQDYLVKGEVEPSLFARSIRYAIHRKELAVEREALLAAEQQARENAERAVKARDQVLRVVSHDLGNHIMAIRINALVVSRVIDSPEAQGENRARMAEILQQVEVMSTLRQDLLVAAAIEAGRLSIHPGRLYVEGVLEAAADVARPLAQDRELRITLDCPPDLPTLRGDADRLRQALGNLLGNAIKFAPRGSEIVVGARLVEGSLHLFVSDEGPGIEPELVDQIFESFWKAGAENTGGAGLGLGIVRGIAEAHGGRTWYEPREPTGSTFIIAIPADEPEGERGTTPEP